jgi:E3 ubiquitin-protein ligase SHPRH
MCCYSCIPRLYIDLDVLQIEAITRRILWIKATDHKSKVLVFSSWNDVLDVLEHAFAANNITFIRMKGGRYSNTCYCYFIFYLSIYAG